MYGADRLIASFPAVARFALDDDTAARLALQISEHVRSQDGIDDPFTALGNALARHDMSTGRVIETAEFLPGSCDPHGLAWHDGAFYGCDAGIHPGWENKDSPTAGWIFQIDFV